MQQRVKRLAWAASRHERHPLAAVHTGGAHSTSPSGTSAWLQAQRAQHRAAQHSTAHGSHMRLLSSALALIQCGHRIPWGDGPTGSAQHAQRQHVASDQPWQHASCSRTQASPADKPPRPTSLRLTKPLRPNKPPADKPHGLTAAWQLHPAACAFSATPGPPSRLHQGFPGHLGM
jgi:hypothetical protein